MVPFRDNLRYRSLPWGSITLFTINVLMYIGQLTLRSVGKMDSTIAGWQASRDGFVGALASGYPDQVLQNVGALFVAPFLHGYLLHILLNMCFFFTFAPALEARMGRLKFVLFYVVAGAVSMLAFILTIDNGIGRNLGASGAIGAVLGAYIICFPRARIDVWFPPAMAPLTTISVFLLGDFFLTQWASIFQGLHSTGGEATSVAFWAHIGGITFGMPVGALLVVSEVSLMRWKYLCFYFVTLTLTVVELLVPFQSEQAQLLGAASLVFVVAAGHMLLLPRLSTSRLRNLVMPLTTLGVCSVLVFVWQEALAVARSPSLSEQNLHVVVVAMTIMIVSAAVAMIARQLPAVRKPLVTMPVRNRHDRISAEILLDAITGFSWLVVGAIFGGLELATLMFQNAIAGVAGLLYSVYQMAILQTLRKRLLDIVAGTKVLCSICRLRR